MSEQNVMIHLPESYLELHARARAQRLLDEGTFREMLGPFDRVCSTWLLQQGIVPQNDDGVVIAKGSLAGSPALIVALEGRFQGGSIGEVSGSKILAALQLTREECEQGRPRVPVLLMETGGVRLQEANLGLELISEIHAEILALRDMVPVICVIAGAVGCFGGMSIAAALCSYILMSPQGRFGLNGPEVIEQEAGVEELDADDRELAWALLGGAQRVRTGMADSLVADDMAEVRKHIVASMKLGVRRSHRSSDVDRYLRLLTAEDASRVWEADDVHNLMLDQVPA